MARDHRTRDTSLFAMVTRYRQFTEVPLSKSGGMLVETKMMMMICPRRRRAGDYVIIRATVPGELGPTSRHVTGSHPLIRY